MQEAQSSFCVLIGTGLLLLHYDSVCIFSIIVVEVEFWHHVFPIVVVALFWPVAEAVTNIRLAILDVSFTFRYIQRVVYIL
jgi:hypothetical protein